MDQAKTAKTGELHCTHGVCSDYMKWLQCQSVNNLLLICNLPTVSLLGLIYIIKCTAYAEKQCMPSHNMCISTYVKDIFISKKRCNTIVLQSQSITILVQSVYLCMICFVLDFHFFNFYFKFLQL